MSYSSLLGSFSKGPINSTLDAVKQSEIIAPPSKRRKLRDPIPPDRAFDRRCETEGWKSSPSSHRYEASPSERTVRTNGDVDKKNDPNMSSINDAPRATEFYKAHFDIDEPEKLTRKAITQYHNVLGKITASNPDFLLDTSGFVTQKTTKAPSESVPVDPTSKGDLLYQTLSCYADIIHTDHSAANRRSFRDLLTTHALEHILTTRKLVLKNNEKLGKMSNEPDHISDRRDQGFTRPKILFLLPTRNSCYEIVTLLLRIANRETVENKSRFENEFGPGSLDKPLLNKPEDFKLLFSGNSDDMFRVGLKITRRTVKLFSSFYNSDIILASPLGIKTVIGGTGKTRGDIDFLSSIEVVYVDSVDALLMQNWDHVDAVFSSLNQMPKDPHGCDFSRLRNWYLNGNANRYRQTIISGAFLSPETNALVTRHAKNHSGFLKIHDQASGELCRSIPQFFTQIPCPQLISDPDARFDHFTKSIFPSWKDSGTIESGGIMMFLSSYLDFVRLRNYLSKLGESFGEICEYSSVSDISRSRTFFLSGRCKIMLYTERAHHFRRYHIKGVSRLFLYNLPANPIFYTEMVGYLRGSIADGKTSLDVARVQALFTKWDALKLERVVGRVGYEKLRMIDRPDEILDFEFP